jgi:hypothetical protein
VLAERFRESRCPSESEISSDKKPSDSAFSGATSGKPGETTIVPSIKLPSFPVQISVVFDWLLLLRLSPQHADELFSFEILASATVAPRPD